MRRQSKKTELIYRRFRAPLLRELREKKLRCQACPKIDPLAPLHRASTMHELRKRSAGGSIINSQNLLPVCDFANLWIENNPKKAHELKLVLREGDKLFEEVGKKNDAQYFV